MITKLVEIARPMAYKHIVQGKEKYLISKIYSKIKVCLSIFRKQHMLPV